MNLRKIFSRDESELTKLTSLHVIFFNTGVIWKTHNFLKKILKCSQNNINNLENRALFWRHIPSCKDVTGNPYCHLKIFQEVATILKKWMLIGLMIVCPNDSTVQKLCSCENALQTVGCFRQLPQPYQLYGMYLCLKGQCRFIIFSVWCRCHTGLLCRTHHDAKDWMLWHLGWFKEI